MASNWFGSETACVLNALAWRVLALRAFVWIFVKGGFLQVNVYQVCKGREPRNDVGELFLGGFFVGSLESFAEFFHLIFQPLVGSFYATFAVSLK